MGKNDSQRPVRCWQYRSLTGAIVNCGVWLTAYLCFRVATEVLPHGRSPYVMGTLGVLLLPVLFVLEQWIKAGGPLRSTIPKAPGWPRFWELFGYCLPKKPRERVYEPGRNELLEDYLETRGRYRTAWSRRWLCFCFTFRTVLLVVDCWRALVTDKAVGIILQPIRSLFGR
jgi:hypothetical protein